MHKPKLLLSALAVICLGIFACYATVSAQSVTERIPLNMWSGLNAFIFDQGWNYSTTKVAVNPATNRVYVLAALDSPPCAAFGSVVEFDGSSNGSRVFCLGHEKEVIGVNPVTNRIYMTDWYYRIVTVLDLNTGNVQDVSGADCHSGATANCQCPRHQTAARLPVSEFQSISRCRK